MKTSARQQRLQCFFQRNLIHPASGISRRHIAAGITLLLAATPALGQLPATPANWLASVPAFSLAAPAQVGGLVIHQRTAASQPFTVAGACGAFVGQGDGSFEAWTWPVKLLSHMHITARLQDYTVPIDVNEQSAEISVQPDHTTITFAHAAFTVREILFAPRCEAGEGSATSTTNASAHPGVVALFQIDSTKPVELTFSFTPELKRMWPAPNDNAPSPEWVPLTAGKDGYYLLHSDSAELAGAIAMPGTQPGILAPYQERPKNYPLQLVLQYDPARDRDHYFPLLMASGTSVVDASKESLTRQLAFTGSRVPALYEATAQYYEKFFETRVTAETPDPRIDQALAWAEVSIDQLRVRHQSSEYGDEMGLIAGLYSSGDSTRPGFGWFFGRDSLYTLYAADSYGDFSLTRQELDFLLKRQRADGKIMHEYSQTAELVNWPKLPYEYAAADSTPLLLMLLRDYATRSGDTAYLQQHWEQVHKAWLFETTHDSNGDGIYDNAQGTGWVESWPSGMPHQEVYLAALDEQASLAYAQLATLAGKPNEAAAARAVQVAATLRAEYKPASDAGGGMYAFSDNGKDATGKPMLDTTATIYPSVAWWDGTFTLDGSEGMFRRWASHEFSTDWGTRDLGEHESIYDPMSYHQGSVWPLFTGWASLAEYRTGRSLSGYAHLMQNADMTWSQDLGAVTELLSGQYFEPFGRSTTHQLWSSAMVIAPALRGLFGVSFDAGSNTLTLAPQLPATWEHATLRHVPVAHGQRVTLQFQRRRTALIVQVTAESNAAGGAPLPRLQGPAGAATKQDELSIPLPGAELDIPAELPLAGAATQQLKVLEQHADGHSASWVLEAQGGTVYSLPLRLNGIRAAHAEGATLLSQAPMPALAPLSGDALLASRAQSAQSTDAASALDTLQVRFPDGAGYKQQTISVRW
ncbi:amylo-alpha-1,6-glucosidase [Acidipila sp. EB88]|uniref:amylo-alpha-1,6-glucosidase n=1 Tax=Acidipila sp. EB88 TaxID=2305226 RepID=UPI00131591AC|nr:glycogen debranching protein [Acidipila sp. EB88]